MDAIRGDCFIGGCGITIQGAVVPGAAIFPANAEGSAAINSTVANAAGQWALSGPPPGQSMRLKFGYQVSKSGEGPPHGDRHPIDSDLLVIGEISEAATLCCTKSELYQYLRL